MAFQRPTLVQLVDRIQADFVSRLDLASAMLRRAVVYILVRVVAGAVHMLHGHLEFLSLQLFADTAEAEFLVRLAGLFGVTPTAADFAKASVTATGTNGTPIPAGSLLLKDGLEYRTDTLATIASGTATLAITAVVAGAAATLTAGMTLQLESPISGVDTSVTVVASTQDGADEETTDELRTRFLERLREPPHGGNTADYVAWAKTVSGVTRVWVTPKGLGPGTVVVRFVCDDDPVSIFPTVGKVAEVQAEFDAEAPAHATATAVAPTAAPMAFTLHIVPDTTDLRNAVNAELDDMFKRTQSPGSTTLISRVRTTIGDTPGITDYTLTSPAADTTHTANQLATRGAMTWT